MALKIMFADERNLFPDGRFKEYLCDTEADLPISGLRIGETAIIKNTGDIWIANSSTTFLKKTGASGQGSASWGEITGSLSAQTDLQTALDNKSIVGHSHTIGDVTSLQTELNNKSDVNHNHLGAYEPANENIQAHIISVHAPSNAQKNSDIIKAEIEAKLTGEISSHTHAGGGGDNQIIVRKTSDTANATTTMADTGLSFNALANSDYVIEGWLLWNTSATTVGIKLSGSFSGASPNAIAGQWIVNVANGTLDGAAFNANDVTVQTTAAPFTTNNHAVFFALLRTGVNAGTFKIRFAAETTGTITMKTGSVMRYQKTL